MTEPTHHFRALIKQRGVNPYVIVSAALAAQLKAEWRKALPVHAWINGAPADGWRVNLMPIGDGRFYLYLNGDVRDQAGVGVGDRVDVRLRFNARYKGGPADPMPPWFETALKKNAKARRGWDALTPSLQKEILRYLARLKTPEARAGNLEKALRVLSGQPGKFLARDWNE